MSEHLRRQTPRSLNITLVETRPDDRGAVYNNAAVRIHEKHKLQCCLVVLTQGDQRGGTCSGTASGPTVPTASSCRRWRRRRQTTQTPTAQSTDTCCMVRLATVLPAARGQTFLTLFMEIFYFHEQTCAARKADVDPEVVATFLRNAACLKMTAAVIPPQEKGLSSQLFVLCRSCFSGLNSHSCDLCLQTSASEPRRTVSVSFSISCSDFRLKFQPFASGLLQDGAVAPSVQIIRLKCDNCEIVKFSLKNKW